jgi:hypothetical protein
VLIAYPCLIGSPPAQQTICAPVATARLLELSVAANHGPTDHHKGFVPLRCAQSALSFA